MKTYIQQKIVKTSKKSREGEGKLIFLYDKLMTEEEQEKLLLPIQFISFGVMKGTLYEVVIRRIQFGRKAIRTLRTFASEKESSTKHLFGGIFLVRDWQMQKQKIFGYYYNNSAYNKKTLPEDLFDFKEVKVNPIKFKSLKDLEKSKYEVGKEIECGVFVGNKNNKRISTNTKTSYYYKKGQVDKENFIKLIKEKTKGE